MNESANCNAFFVCGERKRDGGEVFDLFFKKNDG